MSAVPKLLNVVDFAHRVVGPKPLEYISGAINRASGHAIPEWNPYMPRARPSLPPRAWATQHGMFIIPLGTPSCSQQACRDGCSEGDHFTQLAVHDTSAKQQAVTALVVW